MSSYTRKFWQYSLSYYYYYRLLVLNSAAWGPWDLCLISPPGPSPLSLSAQFLPVCCKLRQQNLRTNQLLLHLYLEIRMTLIIRYLPWQNNKLHIANNHNLFVTRSKVKVGIAYICYFNILQFCKFSLISNQTLKHWYSVQF